MLPASLTDYLIWASYSIYLPIILLVYLVLVRSQRFQRANSIATQHGFGPRASVRTMTADQAQSILKDLVEAEFPKLMGFSIVFALFKTYGFPSVSSLLVSTGELASMETASKRAADTGVLLLEFCLNPPSSTRSLEAVARMNYLHGKYIRAGKIKATDMLYTLSIFALEPPRWIQRFEWRHMTEVEMCACGTFWKAMGDKMEVDFSFLPSARDGWRDGLHWLEEVRVWSEDYEKEYMVPHELNHRLATAHLDVIFVNVPDRFKVYGQYLVSCIVEERLRRAMLLPEPPQILSATIMGVVAVRKLFLRHMCLPRPEFLRKTYISAQAETSGRFSAKEYLSYPWYVKPTWKRRWGLKAWITWIVGRKLPGDDGNRYRPEGYVISGIGPKRFGKQGGKQMELDKERMRALGPGTCPFVIPRK